MRGRSGYLYGFFSLLFIYAGIKHWRGGQPSETPIKNEPNNDIVQETSIHLPLPDAQINVHTVLSSESDEAENIQLQLKNPISVAYTEENYDSNTATTKLALEECRGKWLGERITLQPEAEIDEDAFADLTCENLLFGDIDTDPIYLKAKSYMDLQREHIKQIAENERYFADLIQDGGCDKFKVTQGYHVTPVNQEEAEFPIAFNILLHKDVAQFELLLKSIYRPQNSYCIHLDTKSAEDVFASVRSIANCFDNVFISSKLERVVYAGYTRLQADINCMKDQINVNTQWKYMLNIAGSEMPAKTNLEMVKILKIYNGANDIEGLFGKRVIRKRFEFEWIEDTETLSDYKMRITSTNHPDPPFNLDILRGNSCGVFSRAFMEWVFSDEIPRALLEWSNNTQSPDEQYWATLQHTFTNPQIHPPGGYAGIPDLKPWLSKYVAWDGADPCHGRLVHSICVFGVRDLPYLIERKQFIFNKFSSRFEPLAQRCLGQWIQYKTECQPEFDTQYYEELPFILKD